jgi:hypothetical protein
MAETISLFWLRYMNSLVGASLEWAGLMAGRQALLGQRALATLAHPGPEAAARLLGVVDHCQHDLLAAPFDAARLQHAAAVQSGAAPRSMIESAQFEHQMEWLEAASLGALARSR